MIETEEGEPIFNATIEVFQIVNDRQQYIDHDVTSSKSRAFNFVSLNLFVSTYSFLSFTNL